MRRFNLMILVLLTSLLMSSIPAWSLDRFVDLNDGTMLDTSNSLRWLKNANCYEGQSWYTALSSAAGLKSPSCGLTDGSIAGDWHLPSRDELRIFTDAGYRYDTLNAAGFSNVQNSYYWSSSAYVDGYDPTKNTAWFVFMNDGYVDIDNMSTNHYVWPVRFGQYWSLDSLVILGTVDFGSVPVGFVLPGHQFTLKNSGTTSQSITTMALAGTDPTQFTLATGGSSPCSSLTPTLAAEASCTVMVTAKTTTTGSKSANLTVTTTAGSANIPLTATAILLDSQASVAVTAAATAITPTSATLNGIVNANYNSADVSFEYGTTTAYGSSAIASQSPVAGYSDTTVSAVVTLNPNTLYHFRIKVVNAVTGTLYGNDLTFTTPMQRFVVLNDGTMLDTVNSLRWQQHGICSADWMQDWFFATGSVASLKSSLCGLNDASAAGDWHLPTLVELNALAAGLVYPATELNASGFIDIQKEVYWTSTSPADDTSKAYHVSMVNPTFVVPILKTIINAFLPVRGGQYWKAGSLVVIGSPDFGALALDTVSSAHQFTLKNIGSTPLPVTPITTGGTDSDQFTLTTGGTMPCPSLSPTLAGGASCTVIVTANPTSAGSKSALLTVSTAGGSVNVSLSTATTSSVTYNGNGNSSGTVPNDSTVYSYGTAATVLGNSGVLARTGYLFNGWNTVANGSGTSYAVGAAFTISGENTLYAQWTSSLLPTGLVSWWRGEGNILDSAGGLSGSHVGLAIAAGKVGQAFSLDGTDAYMTVPDNAKLNFGTNEFSLAVWIKSSDTGSYRRIITKRAATGNWYSLALNSGKAFFEIAGSGANCTSTISVADGAWHHLAVSRDPATVSPRKYHLYIDGVENVTLADSGLNLDNTAPLEIGKWSTEAYGGTTYSGLIDEIQIFNRSLTAAEVQNIYNAGSAGLALPATVSAVSPSSGPTGTTVVISGANLTGATAVKFGMNAATGFTFNSDSQITAIAPAGTAGTVADITITTPGGVSAISSVDRFTYSITDQTITLGPVSVIIGVGGYAVVSATASSGLPVSFSSQTNFVCTISGTTVTGVSPGTCTFTATQVGNGVYNAAAPQTEDITIIAASAPTVSTVVTATSITPTGTTATLNGTVNANFSSAAVSFEYGTTNSYGSTAAASQSPVSGGTATGVFAVISGLNPGTRYHVRIKAVNAVTGASYGEDATFTPMPRFVDLNDGTMLDTRNHLRWIKHICFDLDSVDWNTAISRAASLASGSCLLSDASAIGDWRLPSREEYSAMLGPPDNYGYLALEAAGFSGNGGSAYFWTSTSYDTDNAWSTLAYAEYYPHLNESFSGQTFPKTWSHDIRAFAVRSGQYAILNSLVMTGKTDFGVQPLGTAASIQFTLKNIGTASLTVASMALGGANVDQFALSIGGTLPCASLAPTLASGEVCTVLVASRLTTVGSKSATLSVTIASARMTLPLVAHTLSSVTYDGNGNSAGSVPSDSAVYTDGSTVVVLGNSGSLVKSGFQFNGWNTAADGSGTSYAVEATFTMSASVTLYARWPAKIAPPAGLVSWWRGEGNAIDTLGTNNGTLHSDTIFAFATGKAGQAFSFSGAPTEYVSAAYNPTLNFGAGPFSMAVWVNTNDAAGVWKRIVTKRATSGSSNWYSLALNSGKVTFGIAGSSAVSSTVSVANGVWHHIAVTRDPLGTSPRKYHLYIDGVENASISDSGGTLDNTGQLEIGRWGTEAVGGTIYSGLIDEVQLFNRALTSTEIQSIYSAGLAALPVVTGISPSSGSAVGGTSVTISGSDLTSASAVSFSGTSATGFTSDSLTQITAVSPAGVAGHIADVTITTLGGTSAVSSADQFSYTQDQARNQTTSTPYASLAAALSAALSGAEIRAYDSQCDGAFILNKGITLKGGYDGTFKTQGSTPTTLNGSLTVTNGASSTESVVVKGKLAVQGGSLRVRDVKVQP